MQPLFDISYSLERANGNEGLAKDLFKMLLQDLPERADRLQVCMHSHNLDEIREIVHKLYGATAYCGVPQLRRVTEVVEQQFKNQSLEALAQNVAAIIDAMHEIVAKGPAWLEKEWA